MKRWLVVSLVILMAAMLAVGCGKSKAKPTLEVSAKQNGSDVVVDIKTTDFQIGRDGHLHLQMDDGVQVMPFTNEYIIPNVSAGHHKIFVELADMMHNPLNVNQTVEIDVK